MATTVVEPHQDVMHTLGRTAGLRGGGGMSANLSCILTRCYVPMLRCLASPQCRRFLVCVAGCRGEERCYISCTLNSGGGEDDKALGGFLGCLTHQQCMRTKVPAPNCPRPFPSLQEAPPSRDWILEDLEGTWWVVRGLSRTYDCWPCQTMTFAPFPPSFPGSSRNSWNYTYTMQVGTRMHTVPCTIRKPSPVAIDNHRHPGEGNPDFLVEYTLRAGVVQGTDEWHVIAVAPGNAYLLMYYCGTSNLVSGEYQGAIVMARNAHTSQVEVERKGGGIPWQVERAFQKALRERGLSSLRLPRDFCTNNNRQCPL